MLWMVTGALSSFSKKNCSHASRKELHISALCFELHMQTETKSLHGMLHNL